MTFISKRMPTNFPPFFYVKGFFYICDNCDDMLIFKSYFFKDRAPCDLLNGQKVTFLLMHLLLISLQNISVALVFLDLAIYQKKKKCIIFYLLIFFLLAYG